MTLATATADQLEELLALDVACFQHDAWSERTWREVLCHPDCATVVWCPDGRVRAAAVVLPGCPESLLASLAVHPDFRRRGVARALLDDALRRSRQAGAHWLTLQVDRDNEAAVVLYRSAGFVVTRRFREGGRPRFEMRRPLVGNPTGLRRLRRA